jgi:formylglycine-generating enzyme required for sulfatase activity
MVSWNDVQDFVKGLNRQCSEKYRLPTEAEWEYAARSGGRKEWYSGGEHIDTVAWYGKNSKGSTHQVGKKQANGIGLYDMSGNVWEWVNDRYGRYSSDRIQDPQGPSSGKNFVLRGGSWSSHEQIVRTFVRTHCGPDIRLNDLGFRLVRPVR